MASPLGIKPSSTQSTPTPSRSRTSALSKGATFENHLKSKTGSPIAASPAPDAEFEKRQGSFKALVNQIISDPSHPYSKLEPSLRNEMIASIANVLADSPMKLPTKKT